MKVLQGIPPVAFIAWALVAMAATHARAEYTSYELQDQLQQQATQLRYEADEMQWQQKMDKERAVFDESERIYEESERDLYRREDHPEIYGEP